MTKQEARRLHELHGALAAVHAELGEILSSRETTWNLDDLRRDLDRWEKELRSATNADGQHYPEDTIRTHIGHSAQFLRWLAGEWQPHGPRRRP
jgi:hypothetical protein